jgi:hypothetical protein
MLTQFEREIAMPVQDMMFVTLVVAAFSLFGGVLAFASWSESHRNGK